MDIKSNLKEIEKKIGYAFKDKSLLIQAFTRTSYCNEKNFGNRDNLSSNEVLEFFGDSVLSAAIVSMLMRDRTKRYEHGILAELDEGELSIIKSRLSDKKNLSRSIAALGLEKYLLLGEGDEKLDIRHEPSVMEDLFESIIGAVYIDCGTDMSTVIAAVSNMLDVSEYLRREPVTQNPKNALQEWCADKKKRLPAPVYKTLSEDGPDHKKTYERGVYIGERLVARGKGKNQKLADTLAAEAALEILRRETVQKSDNSDAPAKLRAYTSSHKIPSPEFRDLGEAPTSNEYEREYIVECRLDGRCASGIGRSKQEAREAAAMNMLILLNPKQSEKKSAKQTKPKAAQSVKGKSPASNKRSNKPNKITAK